MKKLDDKCFSECTSLTDIVIPEGVQEFAYNCFYGCINLKNVSLPSTLKTANQNTFQGCTSLESIILPKNFYAGPNCFAQCTSLKNVTMLDGASVGDYGFCDCTSLENFTFPKGTRDIPSGCFAGCTNLKMVEIPEEDIEGFGNYSFYGCTNLESIKIPSLVWVVGNNCFYGCEKLKSIDFPDKMENIGAKCFLNCPLEKVTCRAKTPPPYIEENSFSEDTYANSTLYVPKTSIALYQAADVWKKFKTIKTIADDATGIDEIYKEHSKIPYSLSQLKDMDDVSVYTLDGKRIDVTNITNIHPMIVIVKIGSISYKMQLQ